MKEIDALYYKKAEVLYLENQFLTIMEEITLEQIIANRARATQEWINLQQRSLQRGYEVQVQLKNKIISAKDYLIAAQKKNFPHTYKKFHRMVRFIKSPYLI